MLIFILNDLHELRDDEHEGRLTVEEGTRHAGPPADLTVDTLDGVVGADAVPVLAGKTVYAKVSEKSPRATPATSTKRIPLSSLTTASVLDSAVPRPRRTPYRSALRWVRPWPTSICFLPRQLESYRDGPCPLYRDAILLSKCANDCTLPVCQLRRIRPFKLGN